MTHKAKGSLKGFLKSSLKVDPQSLLFPEAPDDVTLYSHKQCIIYMM